MTSDLLNKSMKNFSTQYFLTKLFEMGLVHCLLSYKSIRFRK